MLLNFKLPQIGKVLTVELDPAMWDKTLKSLREDFLNIARTGDDPHKLLFGEEDKEVLQTFLENISLEEFNFFIGAREFGNDETTKVSELFSDGPYLMRLENHKSINYRLSKFSYTSFLLILTNTPKSVQKITLPLSAIKDVTTEQCQELAKALLCISKIHIVDEAGNEVHDHPKVVELASFIKIYGEERIQQAAEKETKRARDENHPQAITEEDAKKNKAGFPGVFFKQEPEISSSKTPGVPFPRN